MSDLAYHLEREQRIAELEAENAELRARIKDGIPCFIAASMPDDVYLFTEEPEWNKKYEWIGWESLYLGAMHIYNLAPGECRKARIVLEPEDNK